MKYLLILLTFNNSQLDTSVLQEYSKMDDCFNYREEVIKMKGRPIINYQAICLMVKRNKVVDL